MGQLQPPIAARKILLVLMRHLLFWSFPSVALLLVSEIVKGDNQASLLLNHSQPLIANNRRTVQW